MATTSGTGLITPDIIAKEALFHLQNNLVMGNLVIGAGLTLVGNMLADISYAAVDPRVKLS